jgi:uncharacterized protein YjbI with pentapeptide repeats
MNKPTGRPSLSRILLNVLFHRGPNNSHGSLHQQSSLPSRPPTTRDPNLWRTHWESLGQPWRTEPEIDTQQQEYLRQRRTIVPDIQQGIYPFKDVKLSRADVEWLLATHNNGRGPINWNDESQRANKGLDLRGANLRLVDLHHLPLARMQGGLGFEQWTHATEEQRDSAVVHMEKAILKWAHLEGAFLRGAHLEGVSFFRAHLQDAHLDEAHLENTFFNEAHLEIVVLTGAILNDERHVGPHLVDIYWGSTNLAVVQWSKVRILGEEQEAQQKEREGIVKSKGMRLKEFERATRANRQLAGTLRNQGLDEEAIRFAYRAQVLQKNVLRFQVLQSGINLIQRLRIFGSWIFSWFLYLLAGYGYRPGRTLLWYLLVICGFAFTYSIVGSLALLPDALVFSLMSFHGRGFFPSLNNSTTLTLHHPLVIFAAAEAVVGLIIEISFIATFTQRFFGK